MAAAAEAPAATPTAAAESRGIFAVPRPVRDLFKRFPLHVYPPEKLPARAPDRARPRPCLYVFATDEAARSGLPSYNPSCLKWQTYLKMAGIDLELVPSNNHASPSGALPFLLPPSSDPRSDAPLAGGKIGQYARDHASGLADTSSPRFEAYLSLLTQFVRPAWVSSSPYHGDPPRCMAEPPADLAMPQLHTLYLLPDNTALLDALYLPSNPLLRAPLLHTLRSAATDEVLKATRRPLLCQTRLLSDAETAFQALSTLLDDNEWFFGDPNPGLFDAEVFAYTYLILDASMGWSDESLSKRLTAFGNLVEHRTRLYERCWGTKSRA
ncbi:mitochondrial outer membrane protein [Drechmeria coniospora]|uniref:Mitochondrial outer membrane protein n=1 Tax=Drechmeria coniospora TaxID=98403 RepID=A0A151GTI6_DRECN|nr:mitochondrial outer membrane protein [Drechmeria coniospora]KYK60436.1 mitochondrial outer membrane protein [Drechmeria coniospora]